MSRDDDEVKGRLLRSLAFHIHKKMPPHEALATCFEAEGKGGRHRQFRQAGQVLEAEGFVPALVVAGVVGEEAAVVLAIVEAAGDHRLLSNAIVALADHLAQGGD